TGRSIESTVIGMFHNRRRSLTWIAITVVPQFAPGADEPHQLLSIFSDVTELKRAEEALRAQAESDALTGLLNRDAILERLEANLRDPLGQRTAVLYIDLDRFKIVNDVLGHAAGDALLVQAA